MTLAESEVHAMRMLAEVEAACRGDRGEMITILLRALVGFSARSPRPAATLEVALRFLEIMIEVETAYERTVQRGAQVSS